MHQNRTKNNNIIQQKKIYKIKFIISYYLFRFTKTYTLYTISTLILLSYLQNV
jgi:hypothetical protein